MNYVYEFMEYSVSIYLIIGKIDPDVYIKMGRLKVNILTRLGGI